MAKRVRRFSISRNKQYETHQLDGQGQLKQVSEISDTDWKEKVKSETFEYLATEYGSLKSIALDRKSVV